MKEHARTTPALGLRVPAGQSLRITGAGRGGFTLIELLVAMGLMALMSVLAWRGLDGISRTQQNLQQRADEVMTLQAALTQWGFDLDAITAQRGLSGLDWDGRAVRLVRRASAAPQAGLQVVAWARQVEAGRGYWTRWQSPPVATRAELEQAWKMAAQWAQTATAASPGHAVRTVALEQWQIFYYRQNAWTNPLSAAGTSVHGAAGDAAARAAEVLPDGVRLVLTLTAGPALGGPLTRDWVRPVLGAGS